MRRYFQFMTFSMVGTISMIMDVGLLLAFVHFGIHSYLAITFAFFFGLGINLWLHASLTFQTRISIKNAIRFLIVVCMNYMLTLGVVIFIEQLGLSYLVGKLISLPVVAIHGFLLSRFWVFST
jgi:putative flippase GtrA